MSTYLILPRKGKAVLAGKALSRKVSFEMGLKGLARLNQVEEGKKERKKEQHKEKHGGRKACVPLGDRKNVAVMSMAGRWRGWGGSGNGAGPLVWTQPGCSLREAKQASDSYGEEFRPISSQQRSIR